MARSLARNTRVFATILTRANFTAANATAQNTWEIKVLDGYSFSQDVASQEIGVNEADSEAECAGTGLARGTLAFNTALNPVDVSFATYARPYLDQQATPQGDCVERILWASAMGTEAGLSTSPNTPANNATYNQSNTAITFSLATSNSNELLPLTLMFVLENTTYVVEQFNVGTAEVDFSIDGIATINWTGNGSRVNEDQVIHNLLKDPGGTLAKELDVDDVTTGQYLGVPATTTSTFLRNKLSTLELSDNDIYGFDKTATGDESTTTNGIPSGGVVSLTAITGADDSFNGGIIYNSTLNEWAFIADTDTTTDDITVSDTYDSMVAGWGNGDNIELFSPAADDTTTITNINTATNVVTLTTISGAADAYIGGRLLNLITGEWVTVIDNTTGASGTITVASADAAKIASWAGTEDVSLYTSEQSSGAVFCIPITGATLTLENNITYLTPEELAIVNLPLAGFAGNRTTSGSLTAYLNTGGQGSGGLLQDLLAKIESSVSNNYKLVFHMGNDSATAPRVDFTILHAQIGIPTTNVEDIISTEISFSAKPWDETNNVASFEDVNELTVAYVSA